MSLLRWASRPYLLFLLATAIPVVPAPAPLHFALLAGILGLGFWRYRRGAAVSFLPDPLFAALPFFWCLNILLMQSFPSPLHVAIHVALFAAGMILLGPEFIRSGRLRTPLALGVTLSALFFFGFLFALKLVFPPFEPAVFQTALLAGLFFFSTLPIAFPAFF